MSAPKHTAGPWLEIETESSVSLDHDEDNRLTGWSDIGPADGPPVAIALGFGAFTDARLDANARLIAAAPDLLEALTGERDWLEAVLKITSDPTVRAGAKRRLTKVRAAIAKATGEGAS